MLPMGPSDDLTVSLFAGAGGCSLGFSAAGLKPQVAADIDQDACATYKANLGVECDLLDLSTDAAISQVIRRIGGRTPFIIVGGPPCQGFSTAGPRNSTDPRNRLIFNYLALVERLRPKWFLFENVEGLLTSNHGSDVVKLSVELAALGYAFRLEKINFAGYGLAQTRKRVIIVGNRVGHFFDLPQATFSYDSGKAKSCSKNPRTPSLLDAIADLPEPGIAESFLAYDPLRKPTPYAENLRSGAGGVSHHVLSPGSGIAAIAQHLRPGQTMRDLPAVLQHDSYRRRANRRVSDGMPTEKRGGPPAGFKRLQGDLNALTITSAASREFIHPTADRALTLRECARLQAFPDDFHFTGGNASIARQIGNAIPPLGAFVIAEAILREDGRAGADVGRCGGGAAGLIGFHLTDALGMSPALATTAAALRAMNGDGNALPLMRQAHA